MAWTPIDLGTTANDGTGDTPRVAGQKINTRMAEAGSAFTADVIDSLISTSLTDALSANQGRVLDEALTAHENATGTEAHGLGTAATRDVTVSNTDTTVGRLLKADDHDIVTGIRTPYVSGNGRDDDTRFIKSVFNNIDFGNDFDNLIYATPKGFNINNKFGYWANAPIADWLYVEVFRHTNVADNDWVMQRVTTMGATTDLRVFVRLKRSGAWRPWQELYHTGNILATTGQSTEFPMTQKAVTDALNNKANTSTQVIAGTGLSGGGDLSANRTLSVNYGTTAGTAAQGNDARITGAAQKSANLSDLSSAAAARQNLGLGTAATSNVTTSDVDTTAGRLLKVGDFSIGRVGVASPLPFSDLNDLTINGVFNVIGHTPNWAFAASGGVVQQFMHGPNQYITQIAYASTSDTIKTRTKTSTTNWTEWKELIHTGNIQSTTGQSTEFPMTQKAVTDAINGISDERDKTDVNEINLGLEVIENLKTFSFKLNKRDWYRQEAAKELIEVEEDGKVTIQEKINTDVMNAPLSDFEENDGSLKRDDVYTGFVAQDLKDTLEELGLGHLGIVKNYAEEYEGGEDRFYIEHLALLPFLVNSIKQLSARVKALEGRQGEEVE